MGKRLFDAKEAVLSRGCCFLTSRLPLSVCCPLVSFRRSSVPLTRFTVTISSSDFSFTGFVTTWLVVLVAEMSFAKAFPPLSSSKLGFLTDLLIVNIDFNVSLAVLGGFCGLEVESTDVVFAATGDFMSASDVDLLGILDFEPDALEGLPALWSFTVAILDAVFSCLCSFRGVISLEITTFMLSVEPFVFAVTGWTLAPAAAAGVFTPLTVVCRLAAATLTARLEAAAGFDPLPLSPDPAACVLALCISEAADVSKTDTSESVLSLTKGSGVFVSECLVSSAAVLVSSLAPLSSTLLLFWRIGSLQRKKKEILREMQPHVGFKVNACSNLHFNSIWEH